MASPHVRESGLRNLGKFCLLVWNAGKICLWYPETWSLESGIQLKESGISLMIMTKNQYLESRIHCVESRHNPRLLDSLTWGELVITSRVEDARFFFFWEGREKSRGRVRSPGKKKPRLFLYSCVSLLTRSIKTYPINLRLSCTLWLLRLHSIRTTQISSSDSWSSFFISTLQEGVGGRGGGEALVEDEWHPPKSSLFQNGLEAKLPPLQRLNSCSLFLRTFCQTFSR